MKYALLLPPSPAPSLERGDGTGGCFQMAGDNAGHGELPLTLLRKNSSRKQPSSTSISANSSAPMEDWEEARDGHTLHCWSPIPPPTKQRHSFRGGGRHGNPNSSPSLAAYPAGSAEAPNHSINAIHSRPLAVLEGSCTPGRSSCCGGGGVPWAEDEETRRLRETIHRRDPAVHGQVVQAGARAHLAAGQRRRQQQAGVKVSPANRHRARRPWLDETTAAREPVGGHNALVYSKHGCDAASSTTAADHLLLHYHHHTDWAMMDRLVASHTSTATPTLLTTRSASTPPPLPPMPRQPTASLTTPPPPRGCSAVPSVATTTCGASHGRLHRCCRHQWPRQSTSATSVAHHGQRTQRDGVKWKMRRSGMDPIS
uniref:Uncharacterized protein n=1 Tax=Oryza nivara TaxID=4536 RepID=A0A0E0J1X9_ORYNI